MIETRNGRDIEKKLEAGDKIHCQGMVVTIGDTIFYNEWFGERDGFYCEFLDTKGNIHYWKQGCDGGYVEPKKN